MNLSDMKISARLILGFAIMGFLIMALGAVALWRSSAIQDDFRTVTDQRIPRVAMLNEVKGQLNQIAIGMRNIALVEDAAEQKRQQGAILASRQKIGELLGRLKSEITTARGKELLSAIEALEGGCVGASRPGANGARAKLEYIKLPVSEGTTVIIANAKYRISDCIAGRCPRTIFRIR